MLVNNPRCEWLSGQPVISSTTPRLTWENASATRGDVQTAYQVQCGSSVGASDLWDSGKVTSAVQLATYAGATLTSRKVVYWRVRTYDAANVASAWKSAVFEMGLLQYSDWGTALYVGYQTGSIGGGNPAPCIRKTFTPSASKTIASARLYASALGVYRPFLNGNRVGSSELAPGWTNYPVRRHYQTYDITAKINAGVANVIGFELGDGWYLGNMSTRGRNYYATDVPRGLCALYINYTDGSYDLIPSDATWTGTSSANLGNDIYNGASSAALLRIPFTSPSIPDSAFGAVSAITRSATAALLAQPNPPIRRQEQIVAVALTNPAIGVYIFDFGQNHSGIPKLTVHGASAGTVVNMQHGEALQKSGNGLLYTGNLRTALQTDTFTCSGLAATEVYEPIHTYHGFRYVAVTGLPSAPSITDMVSNVIHADTIETATFSCSSPLLTRVWQNARWAHRSTAMSVVQDCNQRDERMGWSADQQLFSRSALFMRDNIALYSKIADDIDDSISSAKYADVAPFVSGVGYGNAGWGDAGFIIPWNLYLVTGDTSILTRHYSNMVAALANLPYANAYGDYLNVGQSTNANVFCYAWAYKSASILAQIDTILGQSSGAAAKAATFLATWQTYCSGGVVTGGSQCGYVLGLAFGMIPSSQVSAAVTNLVSSLTANGPLVGFIGLKYLFDVLADNGQLALAYNIALSTTNPSYGYQVNTEGLTTTTEQWDPTNTQTTGVDQVNSYNHPIRGCIAEWLMRDVAGIDLDSAAPGFANVILRPRPGGGVTSASGVYQSPRGRIESDWVVTSTAMSWHIAVPANSTATVTLPASYTHATLAGVTLGSVSGVTSLSADPITGGARYSVPSGTYDLVLTP